MGVRGGGQREWNNRRGNGQRGDGRCRAAGTAAWEQALVRLELESCSGCSGGKKNRMAGMWSKRLPKKNSFFFVRGRRIANGCSLEPRSKQLICVLNFCGGKRKGSLKFEKKNRMFEKLVMCLQKIRLTTMLGFRKVSNGYKNPSIKQKQNIQIFSERRFRN
jgi:hypothetical protein